MLIQPLAAVPSHLVPLSTARRRTVSSDTTGGRSKLDLCNTSGLQKNVADFDAQFAARLCYRTVLHAFTVVNIYNISNIITVL